MCHLNIKSSGRKLALFVCFSSDAGSKDTNSPKQSCTLLNPLTSMVCILKGCQIQVGKFPGDFGVVSGEGRVWGGAVSHWDIMPYS